MSALPTLPTYGPAGMKSGGDYVRIDDLVDALREVGKSGEGHNGDWCAGWNACLAAHARRDAAPAAAPEAPPAGEDREQMQEYREALKAFLAAMDEFGDWDDGYFFYVGRAAFELHEPIRLARAAIAAAEGKQSQPKEQG